MAKVRAIAMGFRDGHMVRPGTEFDMEPVKGKDGKPRFPKWVQLASEPVRPAKPENGDTKPKAAQTAVKVKGLQSAKQEGPEADLKPLAAQAAAKAKIAGAESDADDIA